MTKSFYGGKIVVHAGDCMEVLRTVPANSIDAVVTDPPYHLTSIVKRFGSSNAAPAKGNGAFIRSSRGFMGKQWDGGDIAFRPELWAEVLRVLKPGGHMLCFGGTRTYHRMVCAIEDAGFEIRDQLAWVYGSGFPKSHNVAIGIDKASGSLEARGKRFNTAGQNAGLNQNRELRSDHPDYAGYSPATDSARQWHGWGTALKPAFEPICLARKPLSESTVAANVLRWGTGALNIDGCRIQTADDLGRVNNDSASWGTYGSGPNAAAQGLVSGRWPANLCHDGSPEVLEGFPETTSGTLTPDMNVKASTGWSGGSYADRVKSEFQSNSGSAARFFASFPQEENQCQSPNGHASYAESSFILSSEAVVSVLSRAVEASTQRLVLHKQSYQAQDTNVSGQLLDEIETLLTGMILNIEKRFLRELQPTKHSLSSSLASIAAIPRPIDTTTITISLWKSSGFAEAATFDCIRTNAEAGESDFAKRFHYTSKANADDRLRSLHPTVKPVDLMQWLVRLVCPKGATVIDPFAGTGTTGAAAFIEGRRAVLIEREAEYLADIELRMELLLSGPDERARKLAKAEPHETLPLFA